MRVIAGKFKGQILKVPKGVKIRPTAQKVKAALFNIVGERIGEASFLELFAGGGNVGIEALSRGAKEVFLVENQRICIKTIERNLDQLEVLYNYGFKTQKLKLGTVVTLLPLDVERAIKLLAQKKQKFDFVFLDPPYYQAQLKNALIKIGLYDILKPHSYLIAEHSKRETLPQKLLSLKLMFTREYGDACLSFYRVMSNKK